MFRPAQPKDNQSIRNLLSAEGLVDEEMDFVSRETWVFDDDGISGIFSIREEHGNPYLIHFCVKKSSRNHSIARKLVAAFKQVVRGKGYRQAIINVPVEKERLQRLVSTYFGVAPYAQMDQHYFYLVEA